MVNTEDDFRPFQGARMAVGWAAIHGHLMEFDRASWVRLRETARKNSDLKGTTCGGMVHEAVRHGLLEKRGKGYRLTDKGRDYRAAGDR